MFIFHSSRKSLVLCGCSVVTNEMVLISLFLNCCIFINIEVYNSLNNGAPYNKLGRITILIIYNFNLIEMCGEHNNVYNDLTLCRICVNLFVLKT
jgi:hypothetical protein